MNWSKRLSRQRAPTAAQGRSDWVFCLILAAITFLAYQPAWNGSLLWDDEAHVGGPELRTLDGLRRIWFVPRTTQQYYPLVHTSFWLQQRLFGDSTTGYHLLNILLHVGCAVLVLKILRFLRIPGAELAAIIFALHPVNVESVAWITERKNTLSGFFGLAATLAYLKFDERNRRAQRSRSTSLWALYALAICFFGLGLLAKTAIVTLPLAWLVILWWKHGAICWRRDALTVVPFLFFSAAAGFMTSWVESGNIAYRARSLDFSLLDRCLIAGRAFWFQLSKILWPSNLMFVYPRWNINADVWWQYLFPIGTIGLLVILWTLRRWSRAPLAGVLVYLLLLLPSLGFLNIYFFLFSFVADHWQYLACLGIITPCASGIALLAERLDWKSWFEPATTLLLGGLLFLRTSHESRSYTDIETLYRTAIARNPNCWMAQVNLGNILYQTNRISEAMDLFKQAERNKPAIAHYSLGNSLFNAGRTSEAIEEYKEALRIDPDYAEAYSNLGNVMFQTGRVSEAIEQYNQALRIDPGFAAAHNNLAIALFQTGRFPEAIEHYKESLRISPDSSFTRSNLGAALAQAGRIPEAIKELEAALRINPYDRDARNNLTHLEAMQKAKPQKQ